MAYNELIKNFEKIRGYMREFFVYGFKSREGYTAGSARSYDDERRRVESWLGDCMSFRRTASGKNVFISVDGRAISRNPLFRAWKARSFTSNDITLHFIILDLLKEEGPLSAAGITDGLYDYLLDFDDPPELDESTVRKKLKEYRQLGLITAEKCGREYLYSLSEDSVDLPSWGDALVFFSEEAPLGVIGSFLLDKPFKAPGYYSFKHRYLLHTLDSRIMYELILAINEKKSVEISSFSSRRGENRHRVCPVRFYVSTQSGREYLLAYHYELKKPVFFRLDSIRKISPGPAEEGFDVLAARTRRFEENLWGVSPGEDFSPDHVEITFYAGPEEGFIVDRLMRERRRGSVEKTGDCLYTFTADVYDALELVTWARTFIGRVVSFESNNGLAVSRFYGDLETMAAMYGGEAQ